MQNKQLTELVTLIQLCFFSFEGLGNKQIALKTGLSLSTVHRLAMGHYTLAIQWGTVQAFAKAAGYKITVDDGNISMSLSEKL